MRRRTCVAVIAVTAAVALAGCGSQDAAGGASPSGSAPSATASGSAPPPVSTDPVSPVGSWLVRDDAAVEDGTVLRISDDLSLWASCDYEATDGCNQTSGRWAAGDAGSFIATGGASTLVGCDNVDVAGWFVRARNAGFAGTTLVLVDQAGHELGRLTRG